MQPSSDDTVHGADADAALMNGHSTAIRTLHEFSLKVGDHLRQSIERGLKECKKCILSLSPRFFLNTGWTKREFDSVFTPEILEDSRVVLPVWHGVTKELVHEYSPSLNVKGVDWDRLGEEEV